MGVFCKNKIILELHKRCQKKSISICNAFQNAIFDINTSILIYVHIYVCVYVYACICTYMCICVLYEYTHVCIYINVIKDFRI